MCIFLIKSVKILLIFITLSGLYLPFNRYGVCGLSYCVSGQILIDFLFIIVILLNILTGRGISSVDMEGDYMKFIEVTENYAKVRIMHDDILYAEVFNKS